MTYSKSQSIRTSGDSKNKPSLHCILKCDKYPIPLFDQCFWNFLNRFWVPKWPNFDMSKKDILVVLSYIWGNFQ